jgi:hypothetical protein
VKAVPSFLRVDRHHSRPEREGLGPAVTEKLQGQQSPLRCKRVWRNMMDLPMTLPAHFETRRAPSRCSANLVTLPFPSAIVDAASDRETIVSS